MTELETLFALSEAFAEAKGISEARVSTLVFNDGKRLKGVREGKDIGTRTIERAVDWFSKNWPVGAVWPSEVPRPLAEAPVC